MYVYLAERVSTTGDWWHRLNVADTDFGNFACFSTHSVQDEQGN